MAGACVCTQHHWSFAHEQKVLALACKPGVLEQRVLAYKAPFTLMEFCV